LRAARDALLLQVITGLMQRPDAATREFPLGIVPVGTANASELGWVCARAREQLRSGLLTIT
jgi:hypothetical protein